LRLDLVLPNEGAAAVEAVKAGPHYEAMGWDGLWLTDHLVGVEAFKHTRFGANWLELITCMTHLAAQTRRVRIGAGVLVLPYRDPVITAKMIATLDVLSGGRIDLGVGAGWARREFMAVGRGDIFEERGAYTNEALDVILACLKGGRISFQGRWFNLEKFDVAPSPAQGTRVPIWVGTRGYAKGPLRRAAKYADYWHPDSLTPEEIAAAGEELDEMADRRIPRTLRLHCGDDPARTADLLGRYREAGCVQVACAFDGVESYREFDRAAEALLDAARHLQG